MGKSRRDNRVGTFHLLINSEEGLFLRFNFPFLEVKKLLFSEGTVCKIRHTSIGGGDVRQLAPWANRPRIKERGASCLKIRGELSGANCPGVELSGYRGEGGCGYYCTSTAMAHRISCTYRLNVKLFNKAY